MPACGQFVIVCGITARFDRQHSTGGQGPDEEPPLIHSHRPGSPVFHIGGVIDTAHAGPLGPLVVTVDLSQWQRPAIHLAVVNNQRHRLEFHP